MTAAVSFHRERSFARGKNLGGWFSDIMNEEMFTPLEQKNIRMEGK